MIPACSTGTFGNSETRTRYGACRRCSAIGQALTSPSGACDWTDSPPACSSAETTAQGGDHADESQLRCLLDRDLRPMRQFLGRLDGWTAGKSAAFQEIAAMPASGHSQSCECRPCSAIRAVVRELLGVNPGGVPGLNPRWAKLINRSEP